MRILLLPDDIAGGFSGSFSAKATIRQLQQLGHSVIVLDNSGKMPSTDDKGVRFISVPTDLRWFEHIVSPKLTAWFESICEDVKPTYFIMVGGIQKPATMARAARLRGIKTAFLFYINDFYCNRIYSGLPRGPCTACARFPELPAIWNKCVPISSLPYFAKNIIIRMALGVEIRKAHRILSYGAEQSAIYNLFGVKEEKIRTIGFQFDPSDLDDADIRDDGYFAITGQPVMQKGIHVITEILSRLKTSVRIKISIPNTEIAERVLKQFKIGPSYFRRSTYRNYWAGFSRSLHRFPSGISRAYTSNVLSYYRRICTSGGTLPWQAGACI